jgi:hypothetical protein
MMNEDPPKCSCAVDCAGLHMIGDVLRNRTSNSLTSLFIARLEKGEIAVPAVVWQEYEELFEEEAALIAPHIKKKISLQKKYTVAAAAIADKTNSQFSHGAYDRQTDIYAASICMVERYTLLTTSEQASNFRTWDCCGVADLQSWADSQDE